MAQYRVLEDQQDRTEARYRNWDEEQESVDAFKDLIQRDPTVCDHCFLNRYAVVSREWWRGSFGWMDYVKWEPYPGTGASIPADETTKGTRLACSNCGHRDTKHRPLPKDHVLDFTENISRTLEMKEIPHDRETLRIEVRDRNTSSNQGRQDSHVFGPAVNAAIRDEGGL